MARCHGLHKDENLLTDGMKNCIYKVIKFDCMTREKEWENGARIPTSESFTGCARLLG